MDFVPHSIRNILLKKNTSPIRSIAMCCGKGQSSHLVCPKTWSRGCGGGFAVPKF